MSFAIPTVDTLTPLCSTNSITGGLVTSGANIVTDNKKPVVIPALTSNPRKEALRKEANVVVERENK
jgi:hypothetical protein